MLPLRSFRSGKSLEMNDVYALIRELRHPSENARVLVDPAGLIIEVDAQVEVMFGRSRFEMLDQSINALIPSCFPPKTARRPAFDGCRKDGQIVKTELSYLTAATEVGTFYLYVIRNLGWTPPHLGRSRRPNAPKHQDAL